MSQNRAGSVGNIDPLPGGRADGGRAITTVTPTMLHAMTPCGVLSKR
jgi:hypothetical protein